MLLEPHRRACLEPRTVIVLASSRQSNVLCSETEPKGSSNGKPCRNGQAGFYKTCRRLVHLWSCRRSLIEPSQGCWSAQHSSLRLQSPAATVQTLQTVLNAIMLGVASAVETTVWELPLHARLG